MEHLDDYLLNEYVEGDLDRRRRESVEAHLSICQDCERHLREITALFELLDGVDDVKLMSDLVGPVLAELRPSANPSPNWARSLFLLEIAIAAAMMVWLRPLVDIEFPSAPQIIEQAAGRLHSNLSLAWELTGGEMTSAVNQMMYSWPTLELASGQWLLLLGLALLVWLLGNRLLINTEEKGGRNGRPT